MIVEKPESWAHECMCNKELAEMSAWMEEVNIPFTIQREGVGLTEIYTIFFDQHEIVVLDDEFRLTLKNGEQVSIRTAENAAWMIMALRNVR